MNTRNNEKFIIFLTIISAAGLIVENAIMGWEFWVPIAVVPVILSVIAVHLFGKPEYEIRIIYYFMVAMLLIFYHGIHETSLFDTGLVIILGMICFSILDRQYMIRIFLAEYIFIVLLHIFSLPAGSQLTPDKLTISRLLLHFAVVLLVYFTTEKIMEDRQEYIEDSRSKDLRMERNDEDMEDFLSNISHELRTPVNVVNGMSELLIRKGTGYEARAIKSAGIRLAFQIEDIQDYTECKRSSVVSEESEYEITSLINDVVAAFRLIKDDKDLELVVDMDPALPLRMKGDIKKLHKIMRHVMENSVKFSKSGGIYVKYSAEEAEYGVNLCIEVTDTGIGMDRATLHSLGVDMYQVNKGRDRRTGGIGLGLSVVYGFVHSMGGFVKIESDPGHGTTVRITVPQKVVDERPSLSLSDSFSGIILFHIRPDKYKVTMLREFYRNMASNLASRIRVPLYSTETVYDVERMREKMDVTYIFTGNEEFEEDREYFNGLANEGITVVISADEGYDPGKDSKAIVIPKPIYANPILRILNKGRDGVREGGTKGKVLFEGIKALIVDDEPMNLVVASELFKDYRMIIDTADSGAESIRKYRAGEYDVVFMDHMMPEMDGVEAMRRIRMSAKDLGREVAIVALTANAVSGAREMFIREGFDGFIAKPIDLSDFERVMQRIFPERSIKQGGDRV